jgi:hypothetical protein
MLPPHIEPPYRVVLHNDEEATVLAGERILARFSGGWNVPIGHANACFFAKAANSYNSHYTAVRDARGYVSGIFSVGPQSVHLQSQLELALQQASREPSLTQWSELERRRLQLRLALADFLGKPLSQIPPISSESDQLLGELENIETLLGPE